MEQCGHAIFHDNVIGGMYSYMPLVRFAGRFTWLESHAVADAGHISKGGGLDQDVQLFMFATAHATQVPCGLLPGHKLPDLFDIMFQ